MLQKHFVVYLRVVCAAADGNIRDVTTTGDDVTGIDGDAADDYCR